MSARRYWMRLAISLVVISVGIYFFIGNYRIAIDPQEDTCIDARVLLIDLNDRDIKKGALYAFTSPSSASPVYKTGTRMIKRAVGAPGDTIFIHPNELITVNGQPVGHGFAHLGSAVFEVKKKFMGVRIVPEGHWWMMGDRQMSFDSRYWGSLPQENIYGRAYVLF